MLLYLSRKLIRLTQFLSKQAFSTIFLKNSSSKNNIGRSSRFTILFLFNEWHFLSYSISVPFFLFNFKENNSFLPQFLIIWTKMRAQRCWSDITKNKTTEQNQNCMPCTIRNKFPLNPLLRPFLAFPLQSLWSDLLSNKNGLSKCHFFEKIIEGSRFWGCITK